MNKNGMSAVVVNLLLLAMSITAVSLLGFYINDLVRGADLSPGLSCLELQLDSSIRLQGACFNKETEDIELKVARFGDDYNLKNIDFVFNSISGRDSRSVRCGNGCQSCSVLGGGTSRTYYFDSSGDESRVVMRIFGCAIDEKEIWVCE